MYRECIVNVAMKKKISLMLVLTFMVSVFSVMSVNSVEGEVLKYYIPNEMTNTFKKEMAKYASYSDGDYLVSYSINRTETTSKMLAVNFKNVGNKTFSIYPMLNGSNNSKDVGVDLMGEKFSYDGGITFERTEEYLELAPGKEVLVCFTSYEDKSMEKFEEYPNIMAMVLAGGSKQLKNMTSIQVGMFTMKPELENKNLSIYGDWTVKVKKIKLNKKKLNLKLSKKSKKTFKLKAKISPTNAYNKKLKWTSSNKKVATVNSKGKVTAKKKGTAYIYVEAKDNMFFSAYSMCKVVVKK